MSPYLKKKINGVTYQAHRLVWDEVHGPIPDGFVVHHKDHDKHNNDISNLELMTYTAHARHHNQKYERT